MNTTHRARLARAYAAVADVGYQKALELVTAADNAGKLPDTYDPAGMIGSLQALTGISDPPAPTGSATARPADTAARNGRHPAITDEVEAIIGCSERGNNLFVADADGMVFISQLADEHFLTISWIPENYPGLYVNFQHQSLEQARTAVQEVCAGWLARKNNMDVPVDGEHVASLDGEA